MTATLPYLIGGAMLATLGVLVLGLLNMVRQRSKAGESAGRISNRLMQYRVLFQGAALLLLCLLIWAARR
jgi:hypothetical protein